MIINAYKPVGKTPLQVVDQVKKVRLELKDKKIGYAGRLDPMAEGVLLLMVEPETKNRDRYQKLDKEYVFEILFGIETDSLDTLGIIIKTENTLIESKKIENVIDQFKDEIELPYPIYSSKTVKGKPLYWWARRNKLDEIEIPKKRSKIYRIKLIDFKETENKRLRGVVINKINKVTGDFRQRKIISKWNDFFNKSDQDNFLVAKLDTKVSSGTYVRSMSKMIARELGTVGIALSIKRNMVGNHNIKDSNNFFDHNH